MAKVLGVGGVFFKAADTKALKEWYARVLGFELTPWGGVIFKPLPYGVTVWSPFPEKTTHFEPSHAPFSINYVVDDMAGILARVRKQGVEVLKEEEEPSQGKFAWIMDPAGVKVELWQPAPEEHGLTPGAA